jgi:hypothetical protein
MVESISFFDFKYPFDEFLTYYGWDFAILTAVNFWHMAFLIGMSIWTAQLIFSKIGEYDRSYGTNNIPHNNGFKLLLFGFIYGAVDYAAGVALSVNQETILKMMSFSPQGGSYTTSTQTTTSDANAGTTTTTTSITKTVDRKKDFAALNDLLTVWPDLFWMQRYL